MLSIVFNLLYFNFVPELINRIEKMKQIGLCGLFSLLTIFAFASFPVETQNALTDPEKFRLDKLAFLIGILTTPFLLLYGLPLLLLFIKKKNFRGSLAWGWLAGLVLIILTIIVIAIDYIAGGILIY
jgi:hypothetical protein